MIVDFSSLMRRASDKLSMGFAILDRLAPDLTAEPMRAVAEQLGPRTHYKHFPDACHALVEQTRLRHGPEAVRNLLAVSLWQGMVDMLGSGKWQGLPARVQAHQARQLERLLVQQPQDGQWQTLSDDGYQKDFGLATLRLYAAAAQLVDPRCGIARSIVWRAGLGGLAPACRMVVDLRGFAPMFQIHTHTAYLDEFNEEGWNECYRTCADLYALHPECLGMFGGSWFYDPVLASISPRLTYLSAIPIAGGAHRVLAESEGDFVQDAIATSPSRRQLFEAGRYRPRSFLLAWSQSAQRRWAASNPGPAHPAAHRP